MNASSARRLPTGVWLLGVVSLLMDTSSEMIHSLLPGFLVSVLGASAFAVGIIEGAAEATALIVRIFSGTLSDYLGKRKALAVAGYALGALSKPAFALSTGIGTVLGARLVDRVGKGIRGAPRDALIADLVAPGMRGAAYGVRQALDTVGAFAGPVLAMLLMIAWHDDFRAVFWVAVAPGFLAVALLFAGVREPERPAPEKHVNPIRWASLQRLEAAYWRIVLLGALLMLARFSEAFLVLRAPQAGLPVAAVPLVLVAMNLAYALSAYPFGTLADTASRTALLAFGLGLLIVADIVLAFGDSAVMLFIGVGLWGLHMGATQGLLATMVADAAPAELRGTAFGFFNLVCGLTILFASPLAGALWDRFGAAYTFLAGALFCALAMGAAAANGRLTRLR